MTLKKCITRLKHSLLFLSLFSFLPAQANPLKVIAFNTWGVPFAVKDTFRYAEAMQKIADFNPDLVFLEELFSSKGRRAYHNTLYPYEVNGPHAWPRLVPGGIRLLSKYPVLRSAKMHFQHCVKDDCLSKKGALFALLQLPNGTHLNVIGTHLNARGDDSIRIGQIDQIKDFLDEFAEKGAPLLIGGDFNFNPNSIAYPYVLNRFEAKDMWWETHPKSDPGFTYDATKDTGNPYAYDYCIATHFPLTVERIDFMLTHSGDTHTIVPTESHLIFNEKPFLSDHYGISATFEVN